MKKTEQMNWRISFLIMKSYKKCLISISAHEISDKASVQSSSSSSDFDDPEISVVTVKASVENQTDCEPVDTPPEKQKPPINSAKEVVEDSDKKNE